MNEKFFLSIGNKMHNCMQTFSQFELASISGEPNSSKGIGLR
jgi:hypothetical protein